MVLLTTRMADFRPTALLHLLTLLPGCFPTSLMLIIQLPTLHLLMLPPHTTWSQISACLAASCPLLGVHVVSANPGHLCLPFLAGLPSLTPTPTSTHRSLEVWHTALSPSADCITTRKHQLELGISVHLLACSTPPHAQLTPSPLQAPGTLEGVTTNSTSS